jgi:DNA-binding XRE family transcriptional regulator
MENLHAAAAATSPLRAIREQIGLTREELAARAHIAVRTLVNAEARTARPNRSTKYLIASALGYEVETIFGPSTRRKSETPTGQVEVSHTTGGDGASELRE